MVSTRHRCRAALGERLCAPLVRPQPPAASRRLIDSAADERVSEAETSGYVGGTDEIKLQELVDCMHGRRLGCGGGGRRQFWLEWIARHRGSFEDAAAAVGQQSELFGQRGGHRRGDVEAGQ
jgi:hypothetical protein